MAVSAATALVALVLEEEQLVGGLPEGGPPAGVAAGGEAAAGGGGEAWGGGEENLPPEARAELAAHQGAVSSRVDALIAGCFALLPRLQEVESMVRVLQCVSAAIELVGDGVAPHLGTIAEALPQV